MRTLRQAMLSREQIATIKAEIQRLEEARNLSTDSGIQKQIDVWIEQQKKKLSGSNPK
jgi:hypothetical protein